jgi:uncharacterized protein
MAKKTHGRTASGVPITDELVAELAERAEAGYDVDEMLRLRGGRPRSAWPRRASSPCGSTLENTALRASCDHTEAMSGIAHRRPPTLGQLRARRDEILSLAGRYGASNLRVFGSVARQESDARDVDILIDLEEGRSLLDLARLHVELEDLLDCEVDLAERVKPRLREQVEAEAVPL